MRSPCEDDLWLLSFLVLLDGEKVCKSLERMSCCCLHAEYRLAGVLDELIDNHFVVILLAVLESGESAYSDHVAVASHYRDRFQEVLRFVTVHDDSVLGLKFPSSLVHVKYDDVHAKVQCCLLCAEASAQT